MPLFNRQQVASPGASLVYLLAQKKTGAMMINAKAIFRRSCVVRDNIILPSYYIGQEILLGLALTLNSIKTTSLRSEYYNLKVKTCLKSKKFSLTVTRAPPSSNVSGARTITTINASHQR
jgi:hypothetical protein